MGGGGTDTAAAHSCQAGFRAALLSWQLKHNPYRVTHPVKACSPVDGLAPSIVTPRVILEYFHHPKRTPGHTSIHPPCPPAPSPATGPTTTGTKLCLRNLVGTCLFLDGPFGFRKSKTRPNDKNLFPSALMPSHDFFKTGKKSLFTITGEGIRHGLCVCGGSKVNLVTSAYSFLWERTVVIRLVW